MISSIFDFWRLLWLNIPCILGNVLCVLKKNRNFAAVEWNVLYMSGSLDIKCVLKFIVSWLIFCLDDLYQWSPTFLGPGTSFMEDNFPMDVGVEGRFGIIQVHYVDYTTTDLAGGGIQVTKQAMGSGYKYRRRFAPSPTTHILLCGLVPIQGVYCIGILGTPDPYIVESGVWLFLPLFLYIFPIICVTIFFII